MVNYSFGSKKAFTLAEVLITIAIIGIVAAVTIPTLVHSYKKKIVETRLVKFYSTINRAFELSELENGSASTWEVLPLDIAERQFWFEKYLVPYMKILKFKPTDGSNNFDIIFLDGSVLHTYNRSIDWAYFPLGYDSKVHFLFNFAPYTKSIYAENLKDKLVVPYKYAWDGTLESAKRNCTGTGPSGGIGTGAYCTTWVELNGWKIPKDFPLKF